MSTRNEHALFAFLVTAIAVIGVIVLAILGKPIPELLPAIGGGGIVGGQVLAHTSRTTK